jgi:hypothetical protein
MERYQSSMWVSSRAQLMVWHRSHSQGVVPTSHKFASEPGETRLLSWMLGSFPTRGGLGAGIWVRAASGRYFNKKFPYGFARSVKLDVVV